MVDLPVPMPCAPIESVVTKSNLGSPHRLADRRDTQSSAIAQPQGKPFTDSMINWIRYRYESQRLL
jgi:hypothetical protein